MTPEITNYHGIFSLFDSRTEGLHLKHTITWILLKDNMQLESLQVLSAAALHQVLKVVVFDVSQSRRRAACLMPREDGVQATGSLDIPALPTEVPSMVTGSTFSCQLSQL